MLLAAHWIQDMVSNTAQPGHNGVTSGDLVEDKAVSSFVPVHCIDAHRSFELIDKELKGLRRS